MILTYDEAAIMQIREIKTGTPYLVSLSWVNAGLVVVAVALAVAAGPQRLTGSTAEYISRFG